MKKEIQDYIVIWALISIWFCFLMGYFWLPQSIGIFVSVAAIFFPISIILFSLFFGDDDEQKNS